MGSEYITTKTVNVPIKNIFDQSSLRYDGVSYPGPARFVKSRILEFLKCVFEMQPVGHYKFNEDLEYTELVISDQMTFNQDVVDKRPALIVRRGPIQFSHVSGIDRTMERDKLLLTDKKTKIDILRGSVSIECYGNSQSLQSEELADMVFQMFNMFDVALRQVGFMQIGASSMGQEQPVKVSSKVNYIVTPVLVNYSVQRKWTTEGTNYRRLREIVENRLSTN